MRTRRRQPLLCIGELHTARVGVAHIYGVKPGSRVLYRNDKRLFFPNVLCTCVLSATFSFQHLR